jgi:PHP domain.
MMDNLTVAEALYEIADLLEFTGGDPFKVRAYRKAAEAVGLLPEPVADLAREGRLTRVPGIGKAIAAKIGELLETGRIGYLEELRQAVPPGVVDLTRVPGLGARTAMLLYRRLGVDSLEALELAAREGKLRELPGMGPRREAAILEAVERVRRRPDRVSIGVALPVAEALLQHLRSHPAVLRAEVAGSVRRRQETVADIDVVIATREPAAVREYLDSLPALPRPLDPVLVPPEAFALTLLERTGSPAHLAELAGQGFDPRRTGETPAEAGPGSAAPDAAVYRAMGLPYIPPELREGRGEVAAARAGRLPRLVTLSDLRGDLHVHTTASDGTATLAEMAEAARALGYRYLAICDHSQSLTIARGLTPERLREHVAAIRRLDQWEDFRLLAGAEVDILRDGSLDYPDELLAELDVVVASLHSHLGLPAEEQTERLLRAIANPHVDIIGHPFGRVIARREPAALDFERVLEACARTGTALEISASPSRLDLSDVHARLAREAGVKLVINTDAHSVRELEHMPYGVWQARRGWVEPGDVLNAMDLPDLLDWLATPKQG